MIHDRASEYVVGNLGWLDQGALWTYNIATGTETRIPVDDSRFLGLRAGSDGLFRLTHHHSQTRAVSIRHCANPAVELASVRFDGAKYRFSGDTALWAQVDPTVIVKSDDRNRLILIDGSGKKVTALDLSWFNATNYDLGYQDLVDCLTVRDFGLALVSVQRSSELVLISLETTARVGSIMLAGRGGNPELVSLSSSEILASDYDSLCVADLRTGAVRHSPALQGSRSPNTRQFIGQFELSGNQCAVARPYSGDVILVDLSDFSILHHVPIGGHPLEVCLVSVARLVTRDWKTGKASVATRPST